MLLLVFFEMSRYFVYIFLRKFDKIGLVCILGKEYDLIRFNMIKVMVLESFVDRFVDKDEVFVRK